MKRYIQTRLLFEPRPVFEPSFYSDKYGTITILFQYSVQHNYTIYNSDTYSNNIQCVHTITIAIIVNTTVGPHYCIM